MTYAIAVLVLLLGAAGWGLKHEIGKNAVLEQTVAGQSATIELKEKELETLNAVMLSRQKEKEVIYKDREVVRYKIREVKENAAPTDCINQPVPAAIEQLFLDPADNGDVSDITRRMDSGHTDTPLQPNE